MTFVKLTCSCSDTPFYVNPSHVAYLEKDSEGGALVQFTGEEETYITVKESPEEVLTLFGCNNGG